MPGAVNPQDTFGTSRHKRDGHRQRYAVGVLFGAEI